MSNSLRDALMKAGVANKPQAQKARAEVRKKNRKARGGKPAQEQDGAAAAAAQAQAAKAARDRQLNRERDLAREKKALKARIRALVKDKALNDPRADNPYNFVEGKAVKRVYVTAQQHKQLTQGTLAIAGVGERHYVIPIQTAEKLRELDPNARIHVSEPEPETEAADDPYAEYKIPDDLMW
jgi:uncharacterized protein YaiL (DUF2058 family)